MLVDQFRKLPVMGILRGVKAQELEPLVEAIVSGGLKTVEITMNTAGSAGLIQAAKKLAGQRLVIGAGTVLGTEDLKAALDAGASFIVMPVLVAAIVEVCRKKGVPVFPGALTPGEIYNAWSAGATMVKVFPAKFFGEAYFKEIKGPFEDIELLACGGVTPENIRSFFSSGASAVAFGSSVFRKDWLAKKDYPAISERIKLYLTHLCRKPRP